MPDITHGQPVWDSRNGRRDADIDSMGDETLRSETGAILVEYGMILVVILLVSFALIQIIGGQVLDMFLSVLPGFG